MPRKSIPSTTLIAQVRKYFQLEQQELAAYLGISRAQIANIEAGRRDMSSPVLLRLNPLAQQLPAAPAPSVVLPEPPPTAAPEASLIEARLDVCQHEAGQLRRRLRQLEKQFQRARRWQQALGPLLAGPPDTPADPHAARARRWLLRRQEQAAADLDGYSAAEWHLLRLRAEVLEAEAAALARLLPPI